MSFLKTMYNIGVNTSSDFSLPVVHSIEKTKEYEVRIYERNKYAFIKFYAYEKNAKKEEKKSESKTGNDEVMGHVWKLMKYTQGENETKTCMKLIMPIFVHANNNIEQDPNIDAIKVEMKVMVSLPAEYQENKDDPNKEVLEPPKPNEEDIQFEVLEQFKCYARVFGGFASDQVFKEETSKLRESLSQVKNQDIKVDEGRVVCIAYDPPFKLFGRRNEVLVIAKENI